MRLVCITGREYVVYEGRRVVAHFFDEEHHGVSAAAVEEIRTATYPEAK